MSDRKERGGKGGRMRLRVVLPLLLIMALVAAACGGDDDDSESSSATTTAADENTTTTAAEGGGEEETGPNTPAPKPLAEREKVVLTMSGPIEAFASPLLANYFGEFEKENLEVEIQYIPASDALPLLIQGRTQLAMAGINAGTMNAIAQGSDIRYVASAFVQDAPKAGFWIHKDYLDANGKPDLEKLKGSRINPGIGGGGMGNPAGLPLWLWMQEIGLTPEEVEIVNLPTPADATTAIQNGQLAVGIGLTPYWAAIEESGCCEFLVPTIVNGIYVANSKWMSEKPEAAAAFFRAIMRTNRTYLDGDYKKDKPDVVAALVEILQQPEDVVLSSPSLGFSPTAEIIVADRLDAFQDQFRENGVLEYPTNLPADQIIDTTPVDDVLSGKY